MAIIPPQRKSISQVKAQLLNPATTSHFQVSVSFQDREFNRFKQEVGLNLDQGRLNILCSDAALPGSSFATAELTNNIPGVEKDMFIVELMMIALIYLFIAMQINIYQSDFLKHG